MRDNGLGIPPGMLPKVFDMFTQVDRTLERSQGGLGIGLTLVKRLVEMHGGSVEARARRVTAASSSSACPSPGPRIHGSRHLARRPGECRQRAFWSWMTTGMRRRAWHDCCSSWATRHATRTTAWKGWRSFAVFGPDWSCSTSGCPSSNGYDTARRIRQQVVGPGTWCWWPSPAGGRRRTGGSRGEAGFDLHLTKPAKLADIEKLLADVRENSTRKDGSDNLDVGQL